MDSILIELFQKTDLPDDLFIPINDTLKTNRSYISGETLAQTRDISRAAIGKHIRRLESDGFRIESTAGIGHRLLGVPENRIVPEYISSAYRRSSMSAKDYRIEYFPEIESTNTYAKKIVATSDACYRLILTDFQNAGRGRMARKWVCEHGKDLTFTICLPVQTDVAEFYRFVMMISVSLYRILSPFLPDLAIKWPNDLYVGDRKLCGILSEMILEQMRIESLIVGIGINVNSDPQFERSASILQKTNRTLERNSLVARFLIELDTNLEMYRNGNFAEVYRQWKTHLAYLNKPVTIDTGKGIVEGILRDVMEDGSVVLDRGGETVRFYSGDLMGL